MYQLRPYQQEAVDFAVPRLKTSKKPLLMCLGTGSGKSWIVAEIAKRWGGKVLVLTLSKELCEQDYQKMKTVVGDEVGMYSASWGKKEIENITVATVQSAYKHPELWEDHSLIIGDECLDGDCEVLTKKGWVKLRDYDGESEIAQFEPETRFIDFVKPSRTIHNKNTEVVCFDNGKGWKFYTTRKHRNLVLKSCWTQNVLESQFDRQLIERKRELKIETLTTDDLNINGRAGENYWFFDSGFVSNTLCTTIERLGIMLEADGCVYRTDTNGGITWKVEVSKDRKIKRIRELLGEAHIKFSEQQLTRKGWKEKGWKEPVRFIFTMPSPTIDYKHFANFLTLDKIPKDFIEELLFWDGSVDGNIAHWDTTRQDEALFVQTVAPLCGESISVRYYDRQNPKHKGVYRITVHSSMIKGNSPATKNLGMLERYETLETMDTYCVTVPTSYFLTRKNGIVWVTGNCDNLPIDGMLGKVLGDKKLVGLTATPYGTIGSHKGSWYTTKIWPMHKIKSKAFGWFWQPVEFNLSEKKLIEMGYLSKMKLYSSPIACHILKLASNGSEYTPESIDAWVEQIYNRITEVMTKSVETGMCKKSGIVFMPSVESCIRLEHLCAERGINAKAVHYQTKPQDRDTIINAHKEGKLTWLINQGVATRGFDNPMVDCLVLARPTRSLRLHRQILGRGLRLAEGKELCNVIDLTENCRTWGGPEDVEMGQTRVRGFPCDQILLRGKDISGMEVGKINLRKKKEVRDAPESRDW